ncbi:MAG: queuosine precursor transporter [Sphingomonas sp.]
MTDTPAPRYPRSLFIYALVYGGLVVLAGVLGTKISSLGPLHVESGIFAFLLLVVLSSAVAELHGKETADKLVRFGFIPLILSMALIATVIRLPAAPFWTLQDQFATILGQGARLQLAGLIAYGISQTLNVYVFTRLKGEGTGRAAWLRGLVAGLLSQALDTVLFITIAFYGVVDPGTGEPMPILNIMQGQIIAKLTLVVVFVPILIALFVKLGRALDTRA